MAVASRPITPGPQQAVVSNYIFTPIGNHIPGTDISSATVIMPGDLGLDETADKVIIQTTAQNIRYTLDGTAPTATIGCQLKATDDPKEIGISWGVILTVIEEAPTAVLQVQFGV